MQPKTRFGCLLLANYTNVLIPVCTGNLCFFFANFQGQETVTVTSHVILVCLTVFLSHPV
jgi:hypothetical protein